MVITKEIQTILKTKKQIEKRRKQSKKSLKILSMIKKIFYNNTFYLYYFK